MSELLSAIAPLWSWFVGAAPLAAAPRRVIVVAGGAAGVGTSLVTSLLGAAAAMKGHAVLVVDGDDEALPARVRQLASSFPAYGIVLIDAGSRLATIHEVCAVLGDMPRNGDRMIAVTSTDATAIAAAYALTKSLLAHAPRLELQLLVNGSDATRAAAIGEHFRAGVQRFMRRSVAFAGHLPVDHALGSAQHDGAALAEMLATASAAPAVHEVLGRIVPAPHANTVTPSAAPFPAPLALEA